MPSSGKDDLRRRTRRRSCPRRDAPARSGHTCRTQNQSEPCVRAVASHSFVAFSKSFPVSRVRVQIQSARVKVGPSAPVVRREHQHVRRPREIAHVHLPAFVVDDAVSRSTRDIGIAKASRRRRRRSTPRPRIPRGTLSSAPPRGPPCSFRGVVRVRPVGTRRRTRVLSWFASVRPRIRPPPKSSRGRTRARRRPGTVGPRRRRRRARSRPAPRRGAREFRALEGDLGERAAADGTRVDLLALLLDDGERDGGAVGGDDRAADGARGVRDASRDAAGEGDGVEVVLAHEQKGVAVEARPTEVPAGRGHRESVVRVVVGGGRRRRGRSGSVAPARARRGERASAEWDAERRGNARSGGDRRRGGGQSRAHATTRRDAPSLCRRDHQ